MREILFRGKALYSDYWIEGYYVLLHDCKGNVSHRIYPGYAATDCGDFYPEWDEVDRETVGQYTGLTDKNGNKIFEGDILEFRRGRTHIVKFEDGAFIFTDTAIPVRYADNFEVIGNIHDNPELLEEG